MMPEGGQFAVWQVVPDKEPPPLPARFPLAETDPPPTVPVVRPLNVCWWPFVHIVPCGAVGGHCVPVCASAGIPLLIIDVVTPTAPRAAMVIATNIVVFISPFTKISSR